MSYLVVPDEFRSPLALGEPKLDSEIHSIVGWLEQVNMGYSAIAFGGYFKLGGAPEGALDGQLIDLWGPSVIKGEMNQRELSFRKVYDRRTDVISYTFKMENGIWVGEYSGSATGRGVAHCITTKVIEDAFQVICGHKRLRLT